MTDWCLGSSGCSELLLPFGLVEVKTVVDLHLLVDWVERRLDRVLKVGILELDGHLLAAIWHVVNEDKFGQFTAIRVGPGQVVDSESGIILWEISLEVIEGLVVVSSGSKVDIVGAFWVHGDEIFKIVALQLGESVKDLLGYSTGRYHLLCLDS